VSLIPATFVAGVGFFALTGQGQSITEPKILAAIGMGLFIFVFFYNSGKKNISWLQFYLDNGSPYDCIRDYFFPDFKAQREVKPANYTTRFLQKHQLLPTEAKTKFMHIGEMLGQKIQVSEFKEDMLLLTLFSDKNLLNSDLYISLQDKKLVNNIKLPIVQTFNYFPELEQTFNFYTAQKSETAQFLQNNEEIFTQLLAFAKYRKYNFFISVIENEISCVLQVSYSHLWIDTKDEIILSDNQLVNLANEMSAVREFMDILLQLK